MFRIFGPFAHPVRRHAPFQIIRYACVEATVGALEDIDNPSHACIADDCSVSSHGARSASVSACPCRILATFPGGWKSSPSKKWPAQFASQATADRGFPCAGYAHDQYDHNNPISVCHRGSGTGFAASDNSIESTLLSLNWTCQPRGAY